MFTELNAWPHDVSRDKKENYFFSTEIIDQECILVKMVLSILKTLIPFKELCQGFFFLVGRKENVGKEKRYQKFMVQLSRFIGKIWLNQSKNWNWRKLNVGWFYPIEKGEIFFNEILVKTFGIATLCQSTFSESPRDANHIDFDIYGNLFIKEPRKENDVFFWFSHLLRVFHLQILFSVLDVRLTLSGFLFDNIFVKSFAHGDIIFW